MMMASLTAGLRAMRDAATQITVDDLRKQFDERTIEKLYSNPLKRSFQVLSDILLQRSREAQEREARKAKEAKEAKEAKAAKEAKVAKEARDLTTAKGQSTFPSTLYGTQIGVSGTHRSSTLPPTVTPQKRKVSETESETSYGKLSTETTPSKLTSPEVNIQNLQNQLVYDVLDALYHVTAVPVSWARNRESMRIKYEPFVHSCICN
jgi:hypothetical protein